MDSRRHGRGARRPRALRPGELWRYAVAAALGAVVLVPFGWALRLSLERTFTTLPAVFPGVDALTLENYARLLRFTPFLRWVANSALFAGGVTALNLLLAPMAGYALARGRIRGAGVIFWGILVLWIIPFQVLLLPLYLFLVRVGLVDTYAGLILPLAVDPLAIFIMRQYLLSVPKEYEEAGMIDGCSRVRAFFQVVLPLCTPALMAVAVVTFVFTWGNLIYPLVMTTRESMATLTVGVAGFAYGSIVDWGMTMAATLLGALPTVALFLALNRWFMEGITFAGGMRG